MISEKFIWKKEIGNRVVFQPMEGCDCNEDGSPSELTRRKYLRFAEGQAGIIWLEANAVCQEGRTGVRQMSLKAENIDEFKRLTDDIREKAYATGGFAPLLFLQLTHSGRQSIRPMIAYRNPVYEEKRPLDDSHIVSDEYLDSLPERYELSAKLAKEAGFDGVDVKSCHGYLMQEMLSAYERAGKYGGSFENRSRLFLTCIAAAKSATDIPVVSRLGVCDMVQKPYGFGNDEEGNIDLTESKLLIEKMVSAGVEMLNITLGNPYFNPHINRPYRVGGYKAPETPAEGLQRFWSVQKEIKTAFPTLPIVGSGMSYYHKDMMTKAEEMLQEGVCDFVGFGRQTLAYPTFYADYRKGEFDGKKCCVACSKCTELMRNKCTAGCAVFDEVYKTLYKEKVVCQK